MASLLRGINFIYTFWENTIGHIEYFLIISLFGLVIEKLNQLSKQFPLLNLLMRRADFLFGV